jgi:hypothetical protein
MTSQNAKRKKYFGEKEGKTSWYKRPYEEQIRSLPNKEGNPDVYVVWVSETQGSSYGYNRAVYPTLSGARIGAKALALSGEYARALDRIVILKQDLDDAGFRDRYPISGADFFGYSGR